MQTVETYMGLDGLGLSLWSSVASMMSFRAVLPTTLASCASHKILDESDNEILMANRRKMIMTEVINFYHCSMYVVSFR